MSYELGHSALLYHTHHADVSFQYWPQVMLRFRLRTGASMCQIVLPPVPRCTRVLYHQYHTPVGNALVGVRAAT